MSAPRDLERELAGLRAFHAEVDDAAAAVAARHRGRLRCGRGCASCCSDDLSVTELEAEAIRRAHPDLLREGEPHAPGACAMLGAEGECRVYDARPYVCRTQGLPLRWLTEDEDGEIAEHRAICPLNLESPPHPPLAALSEDDCWLLGPFEERLARMQEERGGEGRRVALRDLFHRRR